MQTEEVVLIDELGASRKSLEDCQGKVQWVYVGDVAYWPLSKEDTERLHRACCGKGEFNGPKGAA